MNVLVCVKRVPATAGKITLTADEQAIDTRYLGFTVSPHEECAVEEAVRLIEANGGTSTVLTLGPEEATDQLREAMAVGIDRRHPPPDRRRRVGRGRDRGRDHRRDPGARGGRRPVRPDPARQRGGRHRATTRSASGSRSRSTGRSCPGAKGLEVRDDGVAVRREAPGGGWEVYDIPRPAVVTVKEGINLPRYPSVPGRLRARKKEIETVALGAAATAPARIRLRVPVEKESAVEILGEGPEAAPRVVEVFRRLGLLA